MNDIWLVGVLAVSVMANMTQLAIPFFRRNGHVTPAQVEGMISGHIVTCRNMTQVLEGLQRMEDKLSRVEDKLGEHVQYHLKHKE